MNRLQIVQRFYERTTEMILDDKKLKKIGTELARARAKRDEWEKKAKDLERKYREAENTCIHEMVHAANLSPEDLSALIRKALHEAPAGDPRMTLEQDKEETEE